MPSSGEQLATLVDTTLKSEGSWADVTTYYGIRELERHETYPRIAWVPRGGSVAQTKYPGGQVRTAGVRERVLRTGLLEHDVFLHHTGFENTEALWRAFIASVTIQASGAIELGAFEWITETTAHDYAVDAYMIRQRVTVRVPIHGSDIGFVVQTRAITTQAHTGTFQGESGDVDVC